ncbi:hypothetical protein OH77DRAFT_1416251 [Trametes cingulata]|nr:hypothetical protein OH77DRAFT_1416251 [Trametes cingulata]
MGRGWQQADEQEFGGGDRTARQEAEARAHPRTANRQAGGRERLASNGNGPRGRKGVWGGFYGERYAFVDWAGVDWDVEAQRGVPGSQMIVA